MLSAIIFILVSAVAALLYVGTFNAVNISLFNILKNFFIMQLFFKGPHQLFGLLAIVVAIGNPIGAAFRPLPESEKRWIFNWVHFVMGNVGHISAITALFLAYDLPINHLSPIYIWTLIM